MIKLLIMTLFPNWLLVVVCLIQGMAIPVYWFQLSIFFTDFSIFQLVSLDLIFFTLCLDWLVLFYFILV